MSCKKTTIGGQALLEGIMMLGPKKYAIAIRKPNGEIELKVEEAKSIKNKWKICGLPFIRGVFALYESMKRGISAIMYSAEFIEEEEVEESKFDKWLDKKFGWEKVQKVLMTISTVIGVILPVLLFILLPTWVTGLFGDSIGNGIIKNLIEGVVRILTFLLFMLSVSKMKDIRRTFSYHGAEHKTIFCYEAGEELTVENVRKFSKEHPRCGTSFLFSVMVISILVFSVVSWSNVWLRMGLRLLLLPVVISLSYEANRLIGRYDNWFTRALRAPGVWFQGFTTFEPDDSMIEIAIEALKPVIPENDEDKW